MWISVEDMCTQWRQEAGMRGLVSMASHTETQHWIYSSLTTFIFIPNVLHTKIRHNSEPMFQDRMDPCFKGVKIWPGPSEYHSRQHCSRLVSILLSSQRHRASVSCSCGCCTLTGATPLWECPAVAHLCLHRVSSETFHLPFCICLNQSDHWPLTSGINKSFWSRLAHRLHRHR